MKKKDRKNIWVVLIFLMALSWLLSEMNILTFSIPWFPIILLIISSGWIYEGYKKGFPSFAVIVFLAGLAWLLGDLKVIRLDIPWIPLMAVIITLGWVVDTYLKKSAK